MLVYFCGTKTEYMIPFAELACYTDVMRTEAEYSELFKQNVPSGKLSSEDLETLSINYWSDLTSHIEKHFTHEDREKITVMAAQKLATLAWPDVIRDFIATKNWGFMTTSVKPVKKQTEDEKIFWKLFKYAWAFFQSMIILKIAVYYFGLESAQNPEETSQIWVWFFFALSAGSLGFFAWRNRKDSE